MLFIIKGINRVKEFFSQMGQREEKGQTLVEYALILVLVVIVVIVAVSALTPKISTSYNTITNEMP